MTVTGTASDTGGGRVAGVEVSTDGGTSWHPATGTTAWTYTYVQHGQGTVPVKVRATDDSANIGAVTSRDLDVRCSCSVFGATVPPIAASDDGSAAELGLRFTPTVDGFASGVRFYKGAGNGGTHVGSLWSTSGQQLATVTFTNETATGWQSASFSQAVALTAGTTYVVSYTAPQGRYAVQSEAFTAAGVQAPPLTVAGGWGATPAGVFANPGQYPANSHKNTNYFVDVMFTTVDESPLGVTNRSPLPGASSVPPGTNVEGRFTKAVVAGSQSITVTTAGQPVAGATSYDAGTPHDHLRPDRPARRRHRLRRPGRRHRQPRQPRLGRRHLVVPQRQGADDARRLPVLAVRGHHDADGARRPTTTTRSPSACASRRPSTARSPRSASTRAPTTPAPTRARSGRPTARRSRPAPSPASRRRAGRR